MVASRWPNVAPVVIRLVAIRLVAIRLAAIRLAAIRLREPCHASLARLSE
jgi:hypothetical protein